MNIHIYIYIIYMYVYIYIYIYIYIIYIYSRTGVAACSGDKQPCLSDNDTQLHVLIDPVALTAGRNAHSFHIYYD